MVKTVVLSPRKTVHTLAKVFICKRGNRNVSHYIYAIESYGPEACSLLAPMATLAPLPRRGKPLLFLVTFRRPFWPNRPFQWRQWSGLGAVKFRRGWLYPLTQGLSPKRGRRPTDPPRENLQMMRTGDRLSCNVHFS